MIRMCRRCKQEKDVVEFGVNRKYTDGIALYCKVCRRKQCLPAFHKPVTEQRCSRCGTVKPASAFWQTRWRKSGIIGACKDCTREQQKKWKAKQKPPIIQPLSGLLWVIKKAISSKRKVAKQDRKREWRRERERFRMRIDRKFRLHRLVSRAMRRSLSGDKKGGLSWLAYVPYTLDQLMRHLAKTIPEGYGWDDFLSGKLHIDHIVPIAAHNFMTTEDPDFQRCFALKNMRLLPASENMHKHDKLPDREFQPSLVLSGGTTSFF